jgi:hypothetical protein
MVPGATVPPAVIVTFPPLHIAVTVGDRAGVSGGALIYIVVLAKQPPAIYDIVAVPDATPVTMPVEPTVATEVLLLLHVPPEVASLSAAVMPGQMVVVPVIDAGALLTVIVIVLDVTGLAVRHVPLLVIMQRIVLPEERELLM